MNPWKSTMSLGLATLWLGGTAAESVAKVFCQALAVDGEYRWETPANWLPFGVPGASDLAVIPSGLTCHVIQPESVADRLRVESRLGIPGTLNIKAGAKLTLDHTDPFARFSDVSGVIRLLGSDAELAFTAWNTTILGSGAIDGECDTAKVTVTAGITLSLAPGVRITGNLQLSGAGSFINQGVVQADNAGTLKIALGGRVDDSAGSNRWKVSIEGTTLEFASGIGTLGPMEGELVVSAGRLLVNKPLTSTGRLKISGGTLEALENTTLGSATNLLNMTGGSIVVSPDETFTHK